MVLHRFPCGWTDGHQGEPGCAAEAFLRTGDSDVDSPCFRTDGFAAKSGNGIDNREHTEFTGDRPDFLDRIDGSRWRFRVDHAEELDPGVGGQGLAHGGWIDRFVVWHRDLDHFTAEPGDEAFEPFSEDT